MKHEVDLKKFEIRTDLTIEILENNKNIDGVISKVEKIDELTVTDFFIDTLGSEKLNKKVGNYITIEFDDITDETNRKKVEEVFERVKGNISGLTSEQVKSSREKCGWKID